jgi:hypothetical protein
MGKKLSRAQSLDAKIHFVIRNKAHAIDMAEEKSAVSGKIPAYKQSSQQLKRSISISIIVVLQAMAADHCVGTYSRAGNLTSPPRLIGKQVSY